LSGEITKEIFKIAFLSFISITIIKTPKKQHNLKHSPFNMFVITVSIYIFTTNVKAREENSMHKAQKLLKSLCSSVAETVPTPNSGFWWSDLLPKRCKLFSVVPEFSYGPNASSRTESGSVWVVKGLCSAD